MRTTNDKNTRINSDLYRKILGFPFVGVFLMALCMSFVACDGDDIVEITEPSPYGTYVGSIDINNIIVAEGGVKRHKEHYDIAQLQIIRGVSQTKFLLWDDKGNLLLNKTVEQTNTEKIKELSIEFKSPDGNSTWKVFSDGTNAKFESYDKTQEDGGTKEVTITFEGKKQE